MLGSSHPAFVSVKKMVSIMFSNLFFDFFQSLAINGLANKFFQGGYDEESEITIFQQWGNHL